MTKSKCQVKSKIQISKCFPKRSIIYLELWLSARPGATCGMIPNLVGFDCTFCLYSADDRSGPGVHSSAPPLATEVASLSKKVTLALPSHIRMFRVGFIFHQLTLNREPLNFEPEYIFLSICHSNSFYLHI